MATSRWLSVQIDRLGLGGTDEWRWNARQPRGCTGGTVIRLGDRCPAAEHVDPELPGLIGLLGEVIEG